MIAEFLQGARRLDGFLGRKIGPAYQAILSVGLAAEIVRHVVELRDLPPLGTLREIITVVFLGLLLVHQLSEFGERMEARRTNHELRKRRGT
jgi:hypothetical protein